MNGEAKGPFDAQQRLLSIGVRQQDIATIRKITASERKSRRLAAADGLDRPDFFGGNSGLFSGNYQDRLASDIGYPRPTITIETQASKGKSRWSRILEPQRTQHVKEIKPVDDIAEQIASYARELVTRDVQPVTLVDFGAGASITMCKAVHLLKEDIKAGKIRVIATNIDTAPTETDIPEIRRRFNSENAAYLIEAISEKTVTFAKADIIELYEMLKGDPIHLLFMIDMLPFTEEYNEALFKIVREMMDPQHGTAVFSFDKTRPGYPPGRPRLPIIRAGLADLQRKGFIYHHPLQVADGELHTSRPSEQFEFEIYQGSEAPQFKLYTV